MKTTLGNRSKTRLRIADVVGYFFYAWNVNYTGRRFGFVVIPFFPRALLGFKFRRFEEERKIRPLKNKAHITICFFYINANFRLGIQKRSWFHIHCEEFRNWKHRFKWWIRELKKGDDLPF